MLAPMTLERNRPWSRIAPHHADRLPDRSPTVGDPIGYACGADGFDPLPLDHAARRLRDGLPVYYATFSECRTEQDRRDARALLRFRQDSR